MAPALSLAVPSGSRSEPKPLIKASREWVVPPRPKPGRKSTKAESSAPARTATAASRSTQKASRERWQDQVAVLEERVRQLEADEGEKCVFYQQQAQKAKLEAATFQQENVQLRREVEQLRAELASARTYRAPESEQAARNRTHRLDDGDAAPVPAKRQRRTGPATSRARSRSSSNASPPVAQTTTSPVAHVTHSPLSDPQPGAPSSPGEPISLQVPRCTFCSSGPDCFCAQVGFDIAQTPKPSPDEHSHSRTGRAKATVEEHADDPFATATIFEPAVPLRLRRVGAATKAPPVWTLEPAVTGAARLIDAAKAVCSGDPYNCPACSDDPFGKAFCNALSTSVCSSQPCASCPSRQGSRADAPPPAAPQPQPVDEGTALLESLTDLPCCGDPILCGSQVCKTEDPIEPNPPPPPPAPGLSPLARGPVETVPCNEAWTALKHHPNIGFADLQMLAEVVAKRTYCKGAVTENPALPAGVVSETFPAPGRPGQTLPSQGSGRRLTVERGAVDEALGILDRARSR